MKRLKNPQSDSYMRLKRWALGTDIMWSYIPSATPNYVDTVGVEGKQKNLPFYTRTILERPENQYKYPKPSHSDENERHGVIDVLNEILDFNKIDFASYLRISLNCVHAEDEVYNSLPHIDHQYPHGNVIMYFTDSGGKTFCESKSAGVYDYHDPSEDDIILFSGKHYMQSPIKGRRVILVATILPLNTPRQE